MATDLTQEFCALRDTYAENQLLGYQQQQTELMKNFATVVSEAVSTSIASHTDKEAGAAKRVQL